MMLTQLAFAASAAAFLITPEMMPPKEGQEETVNILPIAEEPPVPFIIPVDAQAKTIELECKECYGGNSRLSLDFQVQDNKHLLVNGFEVYPAADPMNNDLTAEVTFDGGEKREKLGYSLAVEPIAHDEEDDSELISIALRVIEVSANFVQRVPAVTAKVLQMASGELLIADIVVTESSEEEEPHCDSLWCSAKEWMNQAFDSVKTCGGKAMKAAHKDAPKMEDTEGEMGIFGWKSDEPMPDWDESEFHIMEDEYIEEDQGPVAKFFTTIVAHFIVPIVMGITVGISVAFIFMIAFTIVVRVGRFFRGDQPKRRCRHQPATPQEVASEEEKTGLMNGTAPPHYEERS